MKRSRIKPKARTPEEFARIYGSEERVAWIRGLTCWGCGLRGECENAHTETGGMGRKADARTIAPLCRDCHRKYDEHLFPYDKESTRALVRAYARLVAREWDSKGPEALPNGW